MVQIAVAGGSGQVAREIIDVLRASGKHEITILSRNKVRSEDAIVPGVNWQVVDYENKQNLVKALRGSHTLLSFVQLLSDPENQSQKNLIDAAIDAGVKRFAPSEYGSAGTVNMPWWSGKEEIRKYLRKANENGKVLEYTLFHPGLFMDYLASPYKTARHVDPLETVFDFQNRRAIVVDGHEDAIMTLTTAADLAAVVARAVDYDGEWPEIGGIRGNRMTFSQIIEIGEKIRVKPQDLEAGVLDTSWALRKRHRAVTDEQSSDLFTKVPIGILLSSVKGSWDVSDEFNQLFPDYKFREVEEFLAKVWDGKP
ncbi:hypothetical protein J7T55_015765 [Diaporthe amygdali]|uniref:uncharacterized protein n=1 Tax=Phomopsis amygdali TaxID=1214568 RepID=UPI0022FEE5D5|nr:uncharacterized protein J7T55_015765 [Diaporthe amygdali]KAJ0107300.1 hypothetical protein J7T55_015765 [Diaporthe amygdali]